MKVTCLRLTSHTALPGWASRPKVPALSCKPFLSHVHGNYSNTRRAKPLTSHIFFLSKREFISQKNKCHELKAEPPTPHDLLKSQEPNPHPKPPPSGDTSPRSRSQLPQPDTCKRPLFSLSPSSPQPWLRLMEPGQLQQWRRGWGAQQLDGGRALPPAGQGPSRPWRGRRDKGLFCTVLLENGMRALDSILTLLLVLQSQAGVGGFHREQGPTGVRLHIHNPVRDLALSHILHPLQPSHSPATPRPWRTKSGPFSREGSLTVQQPCNVEDGGLWLRRHAPFASQTRESLQP